MCSNERSVSLTTSINDFKAVIPFDYAPSLAIKVVDKRHSSSEGSKRRHAKPICFIAHTKYQLKSAVIKHETGVCIDLSVP